MASNQLRFEGRVLEELLDRVRNEVGPGARITAANRVRKGGIGGFFAREHFEIVVRRDASPLASPAAPSILDLAEAVNDTERDVVIDLADEQALSTETRDFAELLARLTREDDEPALTVGAAPAMHTAAPATSPWWEVRLAQLGLPSRYMPCNVAESDLRRALADSLSQLPPEPVLPRATSAVVVVVGAAASPVVLAREIASEHGLDPDCVVLATRRPLGVAVPAWLQVCDPATAVERRRSWRRRMHATVVACSTVRGVDDLEWAREMLDGFEPTITWAIVDAGCKREDIAHRADRLGGVDAIALARLDDTVSPASVLELGIPVGRFGTRPATPEAWAELLWRRIRTRS